MNNKSDILKFVDLYTDLYLTVLILPYTDNDELFFELVINKAMDKRIVGYDDAYTCIKFDKDGKFISQGFW